MKLICPECQNDVDLSQYPKIKEEVVVECNMCGITLMVTDINEEVIKAEVIDEGK